LPDGRIGFDHGAGHPLLFLDDAKAPNCQKNNGFNGLGNYSEWPKVAGAVIQAGVSMHYRNQVSRKGLARQQNNLLSFKDSKRYIGCPET
jgi:hypothetical protein